MFVWPHKLILKTCGTTTLLLGLPSLLRIASETCGFGGVWRCFYSRKTFMFPDRQRGPHKDWAQETEFLDKLFGELSPFLPIRREGSSLADRPSPFAHAENSSAYTVGRMNGDHWLLYLTPPQDDVLAPNALASSFALHPAQPTLPLAELSESLSTAMTSPSLPPTISPSTSPTLTSYFTTPSTTNASTGATTPAGGRLVPSRPDQTLEILMSRLSPSSCSAFYHPTTPLSTYTSPLLSTDPGVSDAHALGHALSTELGITDLLPDATLDSFLFSPCGYSSNAVQGDRYATIHVTPEEEYSYASFETNVDFKSAEEEMEGSVASLDIGGGGKVAGSSGGSSMGSRGPQSLSELVEKVLNIFQPAKLSMTLFVSMDDSDDSTTEEVDEEAARLKAHQGMKQLLSPQLLQRYDVVDRILYEFSGYYLAYLVVHEKSGTPAWPERRSAVEC